VLLKHFHLKLVSVAGNLASGTVPEDKLFAFKEDPSINPLSLLKPEIAIFAFC
jgi:hypothetical protein